MWRKQIIIETILSRIVPELKDVKSKRNRNPLYLFLHKTKRYKNVFINGKKRAVYFNVWNMEEGNAKSTDSHNPTRQFLKLKQILLIYS